MRKRIKVGIVGCGTIGKEVAKVCLWGDLKKKTMLVSFYDADKAKKKNFEKYVGRKIAANSIEALIQKSELLIETANGQAALGLLRLAIKKRKDIMIMSIGGLLGKEKLLNLARRNGINVYLPSGALAGIDAIKSASVSKIKSVTLTTKKPPKGLEGAPYLTRRNIKLRGLKRDKIVFKGSAREAVKAFPKNINVSALLSLAGIGATKTRVKIIASPRLTKNVHEVVIEGDFGIIRTITENKPSLANPKTSYLAALSAIATLRGIVDSVRIGT